MKLSALAILAALFVVGCGNTAEGMKEDSAKNRQKSAESTENIVEGAKNAGAAFGAATMLTPKIKTALEADTRLNLPANLIDVDSTDDNVTLTGHVTSRELKDLAGSITTKVIDEAKSKQKLENKLEIKS
jgi:osmotically-inducible protein OsmY